ncbi:MAG: glycoside hydrolase family 2 sugar binding protein [Amycolatopsis sp.]|uniref:glycoside hydrolase family 2 TIM barrel-domain containing protein n=1 Tax=Amycolatopsis sp. TaxID=37632 RepID=UPI0026333AFC|nr:glycoside hydrolase family 2 TIM barrel-domain containing protein [Amycolatopsis sp.]MCU1680519.1 glycoside hydrolase family 2 sugar binding protein [Amycolatopsis sp.]
MIPTSFNHGWGVRPRGLTFFAMRGAPYEAVTLPHDALISSLRDAGAVDGANSGFFPTLDVEYEKTFEVEESAADQRHVVEFEGVYRDARVYVNGALAAHRPYGYSRFFVPIDRLLGYGTANTIRVEATSDEDSRWYTGAGIIRPVTLHRGGLLHLAPEGPRLSTPQVGDDLAVVEVQARIDNESPVRRTVRVRIEIFDEATGRIAAAASAPVTIFPGESADVTRRVFVRDPQLWSPDSPTLYRGRVSLVDDGKDIDDATDTFGIRRIELDPVHGLRINGTAVKLRGACVHHDNGPIGAATIGAADERRVRLLREAGFNAIRSAHNPAGTALLRACDKYGVLVMDEAFDVWTARKARFDYAQDFADWWERDVESMVRKDFNRPSVVLYSIGNEIPEVGSALGAQTGRDLVNTLKRLDPTRFTVSAGQVLLAVGDEAAEVMADQNVGVNDVLASMEDVLLKFWQSPVAARLMEEGYSQVDVAGYNYGDSRYALDPGEFPDRISVGSETSRRSIAENWATILGSPQVIGDFCWTGWDYLGEVGVGRVRPAEQAGIAGFLGPFPYLTAEVGDLDVTGVRRPSSYFRETVFGLRDVPYIAVQKPSLCGVELAVNSFAWRGMEGRWTWPGDEGHPVDIEVYSSADEVELLVNGHSVGKAAAGAGYIAAFTATYEPGTVTAVAYNSGVESGRSELSTAGAVETLSLAPERDHLGLTDESLAFVRIALLDRDGRVNPSWTETVTVTVEGPGVLQGLGSSDPQPDEAITGPTRTTHAGELLAVVRPTGAGSIVIKAAAAGLPEASVVVDVD